MKSSRGFSLIEVVVALTVLSLISLAVVTALRTFAMTQERLDEVSSRTSEMRTVNRFLNRALVDALPLVRGAASGPHSFLQGNRQELIWAAPFSASSRLGGVMIIRLFIADGSLMMQLLPFNDTQQDMPWEAAESFPVVPQLDDFSLEYFDSQYGRWVAEWNSSLVNPDRIRISIAANGRHWPDMIVRLNDSEETFF